MMELLGHRAKRHHLQVKQSGGSIRLWSLSHMSWRACKGRGKMILENSTKSLRIIQLILQGYLHRGEARSRSSTEQVKGNKLKVLQRPGPQSRTCVWTWTELFSLDCRAARQSFSCFTRRMEVVSRCSSSMETDPCWLQPKMLLLNSDLKKETLFVDCQKLCFHFDTKEKGFLPNLNWPWIYV